MSQHPTARAAKSITAKTVGYSNRPDSLQRQNSNWLQRIVGGVALTGLSLSVIASGKAEAVSFTFEKIADTTTSVPGGTSTFDFFFGNPSLDNGDVAFDGLSSEREGIYTSIDSELNVVADENTLVPGSTDTFATFGPLSLDDGNVAFEGGSSLVNGIYSNIGGDLNVIADTTTSVPDSTGTFEFVNSPSLDNGDVAFRGSDQNLKTGIYTKTNGTLNVVVNENTPIPGNTSKNFGAFNSPSISGGNVTFEGDVAEAVEPPGVPYESGIYTSIGGKLNIVANKNTPIPNSTGTFAAFLGSSLDDGDVAFRGYGAFSQSQGFVKPGIYTNIDGNLSLIADTNTLIPGSTGTFGAFLDGPSLDDGIVAFKGASNNSPESIGIYTNLGGSLTEVIAIGDLLESKTIDRLDFGQEGLSGNQIAFTATFDDGSQGVYVATVPEPSSVLGTLAFGAFGTGWILKRRQRQQVVGRAKRVKSCCD